MVGAGISAEFVIPDMAVQSLAYILQTSWPTSKDEVDPALPSGFGKYLAILPHMVKLP